MMQNSAWTQIVQWISTKQSSSNKYGQVPCGIETNTSGSDYSLM